MNKLLIPLMVSLLSGSFGVANAAEGDSSISVGYAQIHSNGLRSFMNKNLRLNNEMRKEMETVIKNDGKASSDIDKYQNLNGFNIKYRYELNDIWGVIGSFTYAWGNFDGDYNLSRSSDAYYSSKGHIKSKYLSVLAGPSYRFNDYASVYGMIGVANNQIKSSYSWNDHGFYSNALSHGDGDEKQNKTNVAYSIGLQTNPVKNVVIDVAYEGAVGGLNSSGFTLGLGYSF
ncbi:TPA: Ail/Lom family outer membrane beta-barrel protein [Salmonella enterica subsp. enterica serovar Napoli]|nr:Ail/Lom family outer membrane beta-barrel protein [Salmonella enterica subsp. enterica serovar Napoli]HBC0333597.1 Ail/Lom family outer membrane beta-barrel protein [Salmonella enterica subsp. enterica serovar Napoli]HBC0354137.1 Ail/Lom family outer membrane beta-barrel protein [Salmonella enterica subsp. enterica serovar Napoli]